ncbi:hypothetical protein L596_025003 [Steinernema carpocapsae]|uniref:Uncharacterized protein n=1 Tax=Steinernema carpocapsae TaxID=34508 RepID=A0A4U5M6I3_STECR|nr:hypothetical protein L596_025003 [Steinernema carpocapsae]
MILNLPWQSLSGPACLQCVQKRVWNEQVPGCLERLIWSTWWSKKDLILKVRSSSGPLSPCILGIYSQTLRNSVFISCDGAE